MPRKKMKTHVKKVNDGTYVVDVYEFIYVPETFRKENISHWNLVKLILPLLRCKVARPNVLFEPST